MWLYFTLVVTTDIQTAAFNLTYITFRTCCFNLFIVYETGNSIIVYLSSWAVLVGIELSHRLFIAIEFARKILAKVMKIVRQLRQKLWKLYDSYTNSINVIVIIKRVYLTIYYFVRYRCQILVSIDRLLFFDKLSTS